MEDQPLDLTEELEDHEHIDTVFRLEVYEYNYIRAPSFLGSLAVPVDDLRRMCQQMPVHLVDEETEPGSERNKADRSLQAQRIKLNRAGMCGSATVDLNDDVDEEEDEAFWVKQFGELEDRSLLSSGENTLEDDPIMAKLAQAADKKAASGSLEDAEQSEYGDEKSNTTPEDAGRDDNGETSSAELEPNVERVGEDNGLGSPQSTTASAMEVLERSKEAEKGMLTAENLQDPARQVSSPSALPIPEEAQAQVAAEEDAGTDGEVEEDEQQPVEEFPQKRQPAINPKTVPGHGWVPALRKKAKTVFTVSAISDGIDDMTGAVEKAEGGEEDAHTVYTRMAAESEADLKSLGGKAYVDEEEEERRYEAMEETGFDVEGDNPRSVLLAPQEPQAAPAPGSEQHLLENMREVGEEEAALEAQRQQMEQEVTSVRSCSIINHYHSLRQCLFYLAKALGCQQNHPSSEFLILVRDHFTIRGIRHI